MKWSLHLKTKGERELDLFRMCCNKNDTGYCHLRDNDLSKPPVVSSTWMKQITRKLLIIACVCARELACSDACVCVHVYKRERYIYIHLHSYFTLEMEQTRGPHEIDSGLYCLVTDVSINFTLITSLGDVCDRQQGPEYCWARVINVSVMQDCCKFTFGLKNCGALLTLHKLLREMDIWQNLLVWSKLINSLNP